MTPDDRLIHIVHDALQKAAVKYQRSHEITGKHAAIIIRELSRVQAILFMRFTSDQTPDNVKEMACFLSGDLPEALRRGVWGAGRRGQRTSLKQKGRLRSDRGGP